MRIITYLTLYITVILAILLTAFNLDAFKENPYGLYIITALSMLSIPIFLYFTVIKRLFNLDRIIENQIDNYSEVKNINKKISSSQNEIDLLDSQLETLFLIIKTLKSKLDLSIIDKINVYQNQLDPHNKLIERVNTNKKNIVLDTAKYDTLTSLPNRIFFNEILNKTISYSKRHEKQFAILLINIDSFKKLLHLIGEPEANKILSDIGERLSEVLRSEDILAKLEGDEFIVLINDIMKPKFASKVAEKLLRVCSQIIEVGNEQFPLTASIGIALYPNDGDSLESILKNVFSALNTAKQRAIGSYEFYTTSIGEEAKQHMAIESELKMAFDQQKLMLHFQPIFELKTGKIIAIEGLLRWEHPTFGVIDPSIFISIAEECGLITAIGEWSIKTICQTLKAWHQEGFTHLSAFIKISPKQLYDKSFSDKIKNILSETNLDANYLEFEISEQVLTQDLTAIKEVIQTLKKLGIRINIDHFGVGYTSITHLKELDINSVKIDKSIIKSIPNNLSDSVIASAIIALGHKLGLIVIAEGIETAEQVEFLTNQQCDYLQGYLLGHPVAVDTLKHELTQLRDEVLL